MKNKIYNGLFKLDDLHWDAVDGRYTPLSGKEYDTIIEECIKSNIHGENVITVVKWAERIRCGNLLLKGLLESRLLVELKDGEPGFIEKEDLL